MSRASSFATKLNRRSWTPSFSRPTSRSPSPVKKKKSLWFRRTAEEKDGEQDNKENQIKKQPSNAGLLQIPDAWQALDDRLKNSPISEVSVLDSSVSKRSSPV